VELSAGAGDSNSVHRIRPLEKDELYGIGVYAPRFAEVFSLQSPTGRAYMLKLGGRCPT
jgi:hypothetical protein